MTCGHATLQVAALKAEKLAKEAERLKIKARP